LAILCFGLGFATLLRAQTNPNDSTLPNQMGGGRASLEDEERVRKKINEFRLEMVLRQWWNLPTEKENKRRNKGLYDRYNFNFMPIGGEFFMQQAIDTAYRQNPDLRVLPEQNVVAMGWHPYWYKEDTYLSYNFGLLSHIAYYSYELNPYTGGYQNFESIFNFKYSDFIPSAHLDTCSVLLSVSCKSSDAAIFLSGLPNARQNLIDSLIFILKEADADGIELSFEEVPRRHKQEFYDYIKDLSYELREVNNHWTIMMSVPIYDKDNVYDLAELRPWVDYFIIQGYNHHISPLGIVEGGIAPLMDKDAALRGTTVNYTNLLDLDSLVRSNYSLQSFTLAHNAEYQKELFDSLNFVLNKLALPVTIKRNSLEQVIELLKLPEAVQLRNLPDIRRLLSRSRAVVQISRSFPPRQPTSFFLFKPEYTQINTLELEQFTRISGVQSVPYIMQDSFSRKLIHSTNPNGKVDTSYNIRQAIRDHIAEIGENYKSALVLGLPYHGAVWNFRSPKPEFEGYAPYGQIRKLLDSIGGDIVYDKYYGGMILTLSDSSFGAVRRIYFDNAATLELKIEAALDEGIAGVSMWALGYDYGYPDLWKLFEQSFALPRVYNADKNKFEKLTLKKSNKVSFTIRYQLKRFSRAIFATFFLVAIFMIIGFNIVLLDWKVRDILFYTGAFRVFYLTLFTMLILLIGSSVGLFIHPTVTFLVGTLLGLTLTWIATVLIQMRNARLP
jgi:Glycosyl hydrolases family 18